VLFKVKGTSDILKIQLPWLFGGNPTSPRGILVGTINGTTKRVDAKDVVYFGEATEGASTVDCGKDNKQENLEKEYMQVQHQMRHQASKKKKTSTTKKVHVGVKHFKRKSLSIKHGALRVDVPEDANKDTIIREAAAKHRFTNQYSPEGSILLLYKDDHVRIVEEDFSLDDYHANSGLNYGKMLFYLLEEKNYKESLESHSESDMPDEEEVCFKPQGEIPFETPASLADTVVEHVGDLDSIDVTPPRPRPGQELQPCTSSSLENQPCTSSSVTRCSTPKNQTCTYHNPGHSG